MAGQARFPKTVPVLMNDEMSAYGGSLKSFGKVYSRIVVQYAR